MNIIITKGGGVGRIRETSTVLISVSDNEKPCSTTLPSLELQVANSAHVWG